MGTRNLTLVQLNNTIRVAQYCQWDGYPSGQGLTVINFIQSADIPAFKEKVAALKEATTEEVQALWQECGADGDWVTMDISDKFYRKYPQFHRNTGADILYMIANNPPGFKVFLDTGFAGDSLFCEYAYLVNLDTKQLECYGGFNKKPLPETERFAYLQEEGSEYYPIRLIAAYEFCDLPTVKELEEAYKEAEEAAEKAA